MTYQVAMVGSDGIVIASDRRELQEPGFGDYGSGSRTNLVKKLHIDRSGRFAWAYAGGEVSPVAAGNVKRELETREISADPDIDAMLKDCGDRSWQVARGPSANSTILFIDGSTKRMRRAKVSPMTIVEEMEGGVCMAGQTYNKASFFPEHLYAEEMGVAQLSALAAYAVRMAHEMDSLCVDGLDIAVYRDSTGKFEFQDSAEYWAKAEKMDRRIRSVFSGSTGRK